MIRLRHFLRLLGMKEEGFLSKLIQLQETSLAKVVTDLLEDQLIEIVNQEMPAVLECITITIVKDLAENC
jgi:hypothetical protein